MADEALDLEDYPRGWRSRVDDVGHWLYKHHLCTQLFEHRICCWYEWWVTRTLEATDG